MAVIDVHAHYFPPELLERLKHPGSGPPGVRLETGPGGNQILHLGSAPPLAMPPGMTDTQQRLVEMDRQGVDVQWLTPLVNALGYALEPQHGATWNRMVNQAMTQTLPGGDRFIAAATVPLQDGPLAALELEYALEIGLTGLILGTHANGKSLDDPDLDPLWKLAAEAKAPIMIHPFGLAPGTRMDRYHLKNLVGNPADTTISAAQLIFGGVVDRFPDLKVLLVHGGGFLPYQFGRWDHGHAVRPEARIHTKRPPSDYLKWFYYDTVTHSPQALRYLQDLVGSDRIALGTDYPFDMADPNPRVTIANATPGDEARSTMETAVPRNLLGL